MLFFSLVRAWLKASVFKNVFLKNRFDVLSTVNKSDEVNVRIINVFVYLEYL